jgi:hypothetical protein
VVGPLEVVEQQRHGPGGGARFDRVDDGVDDAVLTTGVECRLDGTGIARAVAAEQLAQGDPTGVSVGCRRPHGLEERSEGARPLEFVGPADQDGAAPVGRQSPRRLQDPRLADAGFALDQQDADGASRAAHERHWYECSLDVVGTGMTPAGDATFTYDGECTRLELR